MENKMNLMNAEEFMDTVEGMDLKEFEEFIGEELELVDVSDVVKKNSGNAGKVLAGMALTGVAIGIGYIAYKKVLAPAANVASEKLYNKYAELKAKRDAAHREKFEEADYVVVEEEAEVEN